MEVPSAPSKVSAEDVIRAGFYSSYFHIASGQRAIARAFEEALGSDMFRIALVSSVWERSFLVVELAQSLRELLLVQGWASEAELQRFERESGYLSQTALTVVAGKGRAMMLPIA